MSATKCELEAFCVGAAPKFFELPELGKFDASAHLSVQLLVCKGSVLSG